MSASPPPQNAWDEQASRDFLRYGSYFVPERTLQIQTFVELLPPSDSPGASQGCAVIDLCCGEGLLSEAILRARPDWTVYALDGSSEMLQSVGARLHAFGERIVTRPFDLFARSWPALDLPLTAAVSSLAIHHLKGPGKQALFSEVYSHLAPGGIFVIADVIEPSHPSGWRLAADQLDKAVQQQSLALDGSLEGFAVFERMRWNLFRYFDPEDIDFPSPLFDQLKWLEAAGFTAVDVFWMHAGHAIFGGWKPA